VSIILKIGKELRPPQTLRKWVALISYEHGDADRCSTDIITYDSALTEKFKQHVEVLDVLSSWVYRSFQPYAKNRAEKIDFIAQRLPHISPTDLENIFLDSVIADEIHSGCDAVITGFKLRYFDSAGAEFEVEVIRA